MTPFPVNSLFRRHHLFRVSLVLCGPLLGVTALSAQSPLSSSLTIVSEEKVREKGEILPVATEFLGDLSLRERPMPPASLFKVLIARVALRRRVVSPDDDHTVESTFPSTQRTLRWVLFFSSNLAFENLGRQVGVEPLRDEALRSGFLIPPLSVTFGAGRDSALFRGGEERTTAVRVHTYIRALSHTDEMDEPLRWPGECFAGGSNSPLPGRLSGKSGAWGGAAWMVGYCRAGDVVRAVTVLVPYHPPAWKVARREAIRRFYERMGSLPPVDAPL